MIIKIKKGVTPPVSANQSDTGYDVIAQSEGKIVGKLVEGSKELYHSIDYIEYDTGLQIAPPIDFYYGYVQVFPRSSISKYNLSLANSVAILDQGYRGNIIIRYKYIIQPSDLTIIDNLGIVCSVDKTKIYKLGDKIAQMVAVWKEEIEWNPVDNLDETVRGAGGFGSSGQ